VFCIDAAKLRLIVQRLKPFPYFSRLVKSETKIPEQAAII